MKTYKAVDGAPPPAKAKKHGTETPKMIKPSRYAPSHKNKTKS